MEKETTYDDRLKLLNLERLEKREVPLRSVVLL